jgi:TIR domain
MPQNPTFVAFFSYAHHDAQTDPALFEALRNQLQDRVNAKLANARFAIWRDREGLRTGDRWDPKIENEIRTAHILIVALTPRWVESDACRKEYTIFEEVEAEREVGDYVAPILARTTQNQAKHFTEEQSAVYEQIRARQYQSFLAVDFINLTQGEQIALIDKVADDIVGMIDRLRDLPQLPRKRYRPTARPRARAEYDSKAQNFERVDFVKDAEVVLGREVAGQRDVLAGVSFEERLYVQAAKGRIEFGIRRAFLSITDEGSHQLSKIDELRGADRTRYYTTLQDAPEAITVCIDPPPGKSSLAELPLPPATGENFLSKIATGTAELKPTQIKAELLVSLDAEGLYLADGRSLSPRAEAAIKSIMEVATAKLARGKNQTIDTNGLFRRKLPVREHS